MKEAVNGTLAPAALLVTWMVCAPGMDMDPASTLNEALLAERAIADVAEVTLSVTGI